MFLLAAQNPQARLITESRETLPGCLRNPPYPAPVQFDSKVGNMVGKQDQ
jgi:hypothetical protein